MKVKSGGRRSKSKGKEGEEEGEQDEEEGNWCEGFMNLVNALSVADDDKNGKIWWCLVVFGGIWWCLVVFGGV